MVLKKHGPRGVATGGIVYSRRRALPRVIRLKLLEYSLQITPELHYCVSIP
jgi:hypothetical protein